MHLFYAALSSIDTLQELTVINSQDKNILSPFHSMSLTAKF